MMKSSMYLPLEKFSPAQRLTIYLRESLVIIVNIAIAIMMIYVFPSRYYENSNFYITITLLTVIAFTYAFLFTLKVSSERTIIYFHLLTFVNILIAAVLVEVVFFDLVMLSLFYVLTRILISRTNDLLRDIESYLYLVYEVALLSIWAIKDVNTELYLANFLLSQLVVGLIYISRIKTNSPDFLKLSPIMMNLISVPILNKFILPENVLNLSPNDLLDHKFDWNMLILLIFMVFYIFRLYPKSINLSYGYTIISVLIFLQFWFYNSSSDFTSFNSISLSDVQLDLFNGVFILAIILFLMETAENQQKNPVNSFSFGVLILFYSIINARTYRESVSLDFAVVALSIIVFGIVLTKNETHWVWQLPFQGFLVLIQQIGNDNYIEWIATCLHIGYFALFSWIAITKKENRSIDVYLILPSLLLILEWFLGFDEDVFRINIWMEIILIISYLALSLRSSPYNSNIGIKFSTSLYIGLLSLDDASTVAKIANFSQFELAIVLYSIIIGVLMLKSNIDQNHEVFASQFLLIFAIVFNNFGDIADEQLILLLLLLPMILLRFQIQERNQIINIGVHFSAIFFYTFVYSSDIIFTNSKILNSILFPIIIGSYFVRIPDNTSIRKDFITLLTSLLCLFSFLNIFAQGIGSENETPIPYQTVLLIIALSMLLFYKEGNNNNYFIHLMITISFGALFFIQHQELYRYDDKISSSILITNERLIFDSYFLALIIFISISSYLVFKLDLGDSELYYGANVFGLLIFLTFLGHNTLEKSEFPVLHLILIQIVIYLVFASASKRIDLYLLASFFSLLVIFVYDGNDPQTYLSVSDKSFSLTIISFLITPVVYTIQGIRNRGYQTNLKYMPGVFGTLILFAIISVNTIYTIPQELYFLNLLFLLIPALNSRTEGDTSWFFVLAGLYEIIFVGITDEPGIILTEIFEDYYLVTSVFFLIIEVIMLYTLIKTNIAEVWNIAFLMFVIRATFLFTIFRIIDPLTISILILLYGAPLVVQTSLFARRNTPLFQAFTIIIISIGRTANKIQLGDIPFNIGVYVLWSIMIVLFWYRKGIDIQIQSNVIGVFTASLGMLIVNNQFDTLSRIVIILIPMISTLLIGLAYYNRNANLGSNFVVFSVLTILFSTLLHYLNVKDQLEGGEEVLARLIMDWLIFAPLVLEIILFVKPILDKLYESPVTANKADQYIVILLALATVMSLLMGSEDIFVMKLLFIALGFWILSGIYIRDILAWMISLYTVFVMGYLLYQMGGEESATTADGGLSINYTLYFLGMAVIGVAMLVGAVMNEKRYVKEPFTMSLSVTGSILTALAIIVPAFQNSPFPFVNDELSTNIVNFLPNFVWAVQGLALFFLARDLRKDYLSRLSFGILILDIAKTLYDILTGTDNPLIRIIGSISIGIVCVFIFYVFSKEDTSSPLSVQSS